jgi:hypothetical protein
MVTFLMPDGTKVSNDPRFDLEEALRHSSYEQEAQTSAVHTAELQENKGPEDPNDLIPTLGTGQQVQKDDVKEAAETGATPPTAENPDSNEKVAEARKAAEDAQQALLKAQEKLDEDGAGDPNVDMDEWTSAQVMYELRRRNAAKADAGEPLIDLTGVSKKSQVVELLREDDAANPAPTEPPTPPAS